MTPGTSLEPGQHGGHSGDVVARLTGRLAAAEDHVLDVGGIKLGHLAQDGRNDEGAEVVRAAFDQ